MMPNVLDTSWCRQSRSGILVLAFWGIISTVLFVCFDTNLVALISKFIQEPLRKVNTSLFGVIFLYSLGNFLFTLGIHQTVIFGYPIVYNMALMIPFVALPAIGIAIAYAATAGKFNRLEKWTKAGKIKSRIYREWYSDHKTCE